MNAAPTEHFAFPPYSAQPAGGANGWWCVMNCQGFNCLSFPGRPGAKFTTEERAKQLASGWNK